MCDADGLEELVQDLTINTVDFHIVKTSSNSSLQSIFKSLDCLLDLLNSHGVWY